jgi:predicted nucleic acid-binding protein
MIFLDTNFLISFFVNKEKDHERAVEIAKTIENEEKIISKLVVAETITVLKKKLPTKDIVKIYVVLKDFTTVEDVHLFDKAFEQFVKYDGEISFFDAVYIVIMDEFNIYEIVSFDDDFDNKDRIMRIH